MSDANKVLLKKSVKRKQYKAGSDDESVTAKMQKARRGALRQTTFDGKSMIDVL